MKFPSNAPTRFATTLALAAGFAAPWCAAQTLLASNDTAANTSTLSSSLPDAPSTVASVTTSENNTVLRVSTAPEIGYTAQNQASGGKPVGRYALTVNPDQTASPMSAGDKVVAGFRDLYNPINLAGSVISAGYTHAVNGEPNYGTNGNAFAQRVGASIARGSSQIVFGEAILPPLMRIDPRYYVEGSARHNFAQRTVYAVTRVLIARTDGGRETVNAPLLIGYAGAAAMTPLYYPQINRNFKDVATGYGGSLGGAAIGFVVTEFFDDVLYGLHIKQKP